MTSPRSHRERSADYARSNALFVTALSLSSTRGRLNLGHRSWCCALGRTGRLALKREGDGASPSGVWRVRRLFYRADKVVRPRTGLSLRPLRPADGWCDHPADRNYNRLVRHPYPVSAEHLYRDDALYDIVVVLGHNEIPRRRNGGSAIFMHVARPGLRPTEGCIALTLRDLRQVAAYLTTRSVIKI